MNESQTAAPELRSYKRKDVDEFLLALNAEHVRVLTEKDGEIKRLYSECEFYRQESAEKDTAIEALKAQYEAMLADKQKELDGMNARIGEKISLAEKAAAEITAQARVDSEKASLSAKAEADAYVREIKIKADEYCEKSRLLSDMFRENQQKAMMSLEVMNRQLENAANDIERLLSGTEQ